MKITWTEGARQDVERMFSINPRYAIPRIFGNMTSEIKWAWQRVFRGFDDSAYWGLNCHVAKVSLEVLRWMKKSGHGYPVSLSDKEWREILGKMIKGFEAYEHIANSDAFSMRKTNDARSNLIQKWIKQHDEGMKLYAKHYLSLWD